MIRKLLPFATVIVLLPIAAHARAANPINEIVNRFHAASQTWEAPLQRHAELTFGALALIQLVISFAMAWWEGGGRVPDPVEAAALLVRNIMSIGFFYWLMTAFPQWSGWIISSFSQAAAEASGSNVMSPGDVFAMGLDSFLQILKQLTILHPEDSAVLGIFAIAVLAMFSLVCAEMVLTLCMVYFIAGCGVLLMGFGACSFTSEVALAVFRCVFAISARLFGLQLVVSLGTTFMRQAMAQFQGGGFDFAAIGVLIGLALVLLVMSYKIPIVLEQLAGGVGLGVGGAGAMFGAAAGIAGTMAAGAAGASRLTTNIAGAGSVARSAAQLAGTQMARRIANGTAPSSSVRRMASMAGATMRNVASAAAKDVGGRLSGQTRGFGNAGFRIASAIKDENKNLEANTSSLQYRNRR